MPKKRKTREEKIKSGYRLQNFKLKLEENREKKDQEEFGYLAKDYVRKDLTKTMIYSLIVIVLLFLAKKYLG